MKRIVLILAAGLLLTAPGACNCEGDKAPEAKSPEADKPEASKPDKKDAPASAPANTVDKADDSGDKAGAEGDKADGAEGDKAAGGDEPSSLPAKADEGDGAEGDGAEGDGAEGDEAEGDGTEGDGAESDKDAAAKLKAAEARNPMDEIEPGGVYEGPPGKAIVGTWSLTISKAGLPQGLPKEFQKELNAIKKVTMKFDGKKVVVDLGKGKKNTLAYTVKEDSKISATLTTKAGEEAGSVQVTFLDNDNILINSTNFPVQMKGKRTK